MKIETENLVVEYKDDAATKNAVFDAVINYFKEQEAFHGEVIMQSDNCIIDAPEVFAKIADNILKFKVECKE
jgi:predicted HicB family RNase H-like nuclease